MSRPPLKEISPNRRSRGRELTPVERAYIKGLSTGGFTQVKIASITGFTLGAIQSTLDRDKYRINSESRPRSGRPRTYTDRDIRVMARSIKTKPMLTYEQRKRKQDTGLDMGRHKINEIAKDMGLYHYPVKVVKPRKKVVKKVTKKVMKKEKKNATVKSAVK